MMKRTTITREVFISLLLFLITTVNRIDAFTLRPTTTRSRYDIGRITKPSIQPLPKLDRCRDHHLHKTNGILHQSLSSSSSNNRKKWTQRIHHLLQKPRRFFSKGKKKALIALTAFFLMARVATTSGNELLHQKNHNFLASSKPGVEQVMTTTPSWKTSHRGGAFTARKQEQVIVEATTRTLREVGEDLKHHLSGSKIDSLIIFLCTALVPPISQKFKTSPILGFLAAGMLLGPNGFSVISELHTAEALAELGIVFFLFEMGIELSVERLIQMKKDVFGLGLFQFVLSTLIMAGVGSKFLSGPALIVTSASLALSSSAFVLQLLKDKDQLATRYGKASFGVLLFQDLAVVPLLVLTPILAGSGRGLASAVSNAIIKAGLALSSIALIGRYVLNPFFRVVALSKSQEAFLGSILFTVLGMSFLTEGLGLSNTLGAFLAGVLLSETKYRYQIEADIKPFRGILLGLFFVCVGFEIDLALISSQFPVVMGLVLTIVGIKALVTTAIGLGFGLSLSTSQNTGLTLSQGGEFAFVALGLARNLGIVTPEFTKLMLTVVSLTMAMTPFLVEAGSKISEKLEEQSDFSHYLGQDREATEISEGNEDFVVVIGYGIVGKLVCDLLNQKFIKFIGLELDPNKAIQARNRGLPVFFGDITRPEVAEAFNVEKAKAIIITIAERKGINRAILSLRRQFPNKKIFARAVDATHAERLQQTLDVIAMVPVLPEDNLLLTLPFGGAVLKALGAPAEEVTAILENTRKEILTSAGFDTVENELELAQLGMATIVANDTMKEKPPMVAEVMDAYITATKRENTTAVAVNATATEEGG